MRICHIVATHSAWGGLERAVVDLALEQVQLGHEVTILAAPVVLERVDASVRQIALPFGLSRRDPRLLWQLWRELRRVQPDLIHAHANKAAACLNWIRGFLPKLPTVATVQNTKRSVKMFRPYDAVIAVSQRAGAQLGSIPHEVIWNAIPKPETSAELIGDRSEIPFLGGERPVVCAVGRLVDAKAFDVLLKAVVSVDACFWIVGNGELESELKQQAQDLGVADRVWFAGFRRDAEALMELADFMVLSSRREGFPFVFVEMLHRRKVVVGTAVAGVEDVLESPYLVDIEDPKALAAALTHTAQNLRQAQVDFEKYWNLAAEKLDLKKTVFDIDAVYQRLISAK